MSPMSMTAEQAVIYLRNQPHLRPLVEACGFDDPIIEAAERFHSGGEWAALQAFLPKRRGKVLDIGAGRGIVSYSFARDGWDVTALEPDPSEIIGVGAIRELARTGKVHIEIVETWGETLPFASEAFDLVYCRAVLHHSRDLVQMCREAGRVLRYGGMFIAAREHVISKAADLDAFLDSHPLHRLHRAENAYLLTQYLDAIRGGGIDVVRTLNPKESDINLYPGDIADLKRHVARKLAWPFPFAIPNLALELYGRLDRTPGRLYSFIGVKPLRGEPA